MSQRFVLTIPSDLPVQVRVALAREVLEGSVRVNRYLLKSHRVPPLYRTRVVYRQEPDGQDEEFADAVTCLRRGWGDCDDLASWRVAELRNDGFDATLLFRASPVSYGERRLVHCLVRLPNGAEEDPAKILTQAERRRNIIP